MILLIALALLFSLAAHPVLAAEENGNDAVAEESAAETAAEVPEKALEEPAGSDEPAETETDFGTGAPEEETAPEQAVLTEEETAPAAQEDTAEEKPAEEADPSETPDSGEAVEFSRVSESSAEPETAAARDGAEDILSVIEEPDGAPAESRELPAEEEGTEEQPAPGVEKASTATESGDGAGAFADGTYVPDFTYEGGTGKVTISCPKLVMKDGKGTATIVFSSTKYTYVLVDGERYDNENPGGESTFTIPVNVNAPTEISAETVAMSEAHLVDYTLHVGLAEGAEPTEPAASEEPVFADGTYVPDFTYEGGTGKVTISCPKLVMKDGKGTATIVFSSTKYTYVLVDGERYDNENPGGESTFTIPVNVNAPTEISAETVAMSEAHLVDYTLRVGLAEGAEPAEPAGPAEPDEPEKPEEPEEPGGQTEPEEPMISENGVLADGVYRAEVETGQAMFKVVDCVITSEDGKMTAVITLSGTGYDYLYAGSAKEAYAAAGEGWIPFVQDPETGKYTYTLELAAVTEPAAVAARSARYASEGKGEAAWMDRTLTIVLDSIVRISDLPENGDQDGPTDPSENQGTEPAEGGEGKTDGSGNNDSKDSEKEEPENTGTQDEDEIRKMEENTKKGTVADGTYVPSFGFTGGTGKVTISCPKLVVRNGKGTATLVFSSTKYTYVLVNGVKYYNENPGGKGTFTIPVNVNSTTVVSAETTAMSEAHLIDYTLYIYVDGQDVSNIRPSASGNTTGDSADDGAENADTGTREEEEEFGPDGEKKSSGWGEYDSVQTTEAPVTAEEAAVPEAGAETTASEPAAEKPEERKGFSPWYTVGIAAAVIVLAGGGFAVMRKGKKKG